MGLNKFKMNWILNQELAVATAPQKQKDLEKNEEFSDYCNKILSESIVDTSSNMKNELQQYIEEKNFFGNETKNDVVIDKSINGLDNLESKQSPSNFTNEKDIMYASNKELLNFFSIL